MTGPGKRLCAAVLLLCVLTGGVLPVKADTQEYRQQLLKAYSSSPDSNTQAAQPAAGCRTEMHRTILCVLWCLATDLTGTAP